MPDNPHDQTDVPVLIGGGQLTDRRSPEEVSTPIELMVEALRKAAADAGVRRVVLTSSVAAISAGHPADASRVFTEIAKWVAGRADRLGDWMSLQIVGIFAGGLIGSLIAGRFRGNGPAPGYPACPDHLEKLTIWELLDVENKIGVSLTESLAMWPAASVSGYYFAHEQARYFGLGKIKEDQLSDYAQRKGISVEKARKWLAPNLAYEP